MPGGAMDIQRLHHQSPSLECAQGRKAEWMPLLWRSERPTREIHLRLLPRGVFRGGEARSGEIPPAVRKDDGKFGHISGQVDPGSSGRIKHEGDAEKLASLSPNIMIKIPGSTQAWRLSAPRSKGYPRTPLLSTPCRRCSRSHRWWTRAKDTSRGKQNPAFGWRAVVPTCPAVR